MVKLLWWPVCLCLISSTAMYLLLLLFPLKLAFSRIMLLFSAGYVFNTILAPAFGLPLNPQAATENRNLLSASLATIDTYWLQKDGNFLLGNSKPSLADLSLVCEIMQLEV